jgi:hypothetical protein
MRVKFLSIIICLVVCSSLALVLTPPLVRPVEAAPMETLHLSVGELTYVQDFNSRPANLQTGDEIIQFTRPHLIVGTNPVSYFNTMTVGTQPVSGDLSGTMTVSLDSLIATWDGMPSATWQGYVFGTFTFDDGLGNTFSGVHVGDEDVDSTVPIGTTSGYLLSTSGTGQFSGQTLIGTVEGTGNTTTVTLRRYFGGEISPPRVFNSTATVGWPPPPQRSLGISSGPYPTDDFVQFSPPNVSIPKGDSAYYASGISSSGSVTGGFTGTIADRWTDMGTSVAPILGIGKFTYADSSGTITGVRLRDRTAWGTGHGYMFALMGIGNLTGDYAGKDYYGTFNETGMGETNSFQGNLYTLTASEVVQTATGTGTATLAPDSGSMENLVAVSATSPSTSLPQGAIDAAEQAGLNFPHGLFEFRITGLADGDSVALTISLPSAIPDNAQYWKYGPTPGDPTYHWYQIPWTRISSNVIAISLTDGGWGDDDLTADGTIIDQGGPGWPWPTGGGGGSVPVFPSIYIGIGAALGAGILAYFARRRLGHS